ncbi:MAG: 5-(carboxyamino)imidazole ribonucleotide synthase [Granulosicoccus sp.]
MKPRRLNPGATVGVLGGGQLGRYFALSARQNGYHVWVLDPDPQAPAMQIASRAVAAGYDDKKALEEMANACQAITIEFENIPASSLELLNGMTQLAPGQQSVQIAQDRLLEKREAAECGLTPVPHRAVESIEHIDAAWPELSAPVILKTARLGYDGKGQKTCHSVQEAKEAFVEFGSVSCVLEQRVDLAAELSVVLARGFDGELAVFPVAQNTHVNGILFSSAVPADLPQRVQTLAVEQGKALAESIAHVGILAIEFFIDTQGTLYFNEMAPRPHNSGHYTLDATACSQFDQQLRVLCGQALGSTSLHTPVAMINLLGDLWPSDNLPDFTQLLSTEGCQLHLYGKTAARAGRKMGHYNCLAENSDSALKKAIAQFDILNK